MTQSQRLVSAVVFQLTLMLSMTIFRTLGARGQMLSGLFSSQDRNPGDAAPDWLRQRQRLRDPGVRALPRRRNAYLRAKSQ